MPAFDVPANLRFRVPNALHVRGRATIGAHVAQLLEMPTARTAPTTGPATPETGLQHGQRVDEGCQAGDGDEVVANRHADAAVVRRHAPLLDI